jgi:hypothetical protein
VAESIGRLLARVCGIAMLTLLARLLLPPPRGAAGEAAVSRVLRRFCAEVADDVLLPDGRGGLTQLDHLALTGAGLLVVETKNYGGLIFGRRGEPTWTQTLGRSRHRFQNPLRQNFAHLEAVRALAAGAPVLGLVVFLDRARFARDMPEGVLRLTALPAALGPLSQSAPDARLHDAYRQVLAAAVQGTAARREHLAQVRGRARSGAASARREPVVGSLADVVDRQSGQRLATDAARGLAPKLVFALSAAGIAMLGLVGLWVWQTEQSVPQPSAHSVPPATPRPAAPAPPPPTRIVDPPPAPVAVKAPARPLPEPQRPSIRWEDPTASARVSDACRLATAAVLAANTSESRLQQRRACGEVPPAATPPPPQPSAQPVTVDAQPRVLRSAAELTTDH